MKLINELHLFVFFLVFLFSYYSLPLIRKAVFKFNIKNEVKDRSSHVGYVPNFGGVIFYLSYLLVLFFLKDTRVDSNIIYIIISLTFVFFTGFFDDLFSLPPRIKLLGQILSVAVLMYSDQFKIISFYGAFGIYELPIYIAVLGSMVFLLFLINAFNLLDGIDGLSAITSIVISSFYAWFFYISQQNIFFIISVITVASNLAFLRYNFSKKRKIFMGDTGSLVLGLVLGMQTIRLLSMSSIELTQFLFLKNKIILVLISILFIPIFDTMRVIFIRLINKKPLFSADRNHIHHILIDHGYSHKTVSIAIGLINISISFMIFYFAQKFSFVFCFLVLLLLFLFFAFFFFLLNKNKEAVRRKIKLLYKIRNVF